MKIVTVFLIISSVSVCYVTLYPQMPPEYVDVVDRCLHKINCGDRKTPFNLNKAKANEFKVEVMKEFQALKEQSNRGKNLDAQIDNIISIHQKELENINTVHKKDLESVNEKLQGERDLRLYFQSLIDMQENVKYLFEQCWPSWTSKPMPTTFIDKLDYEILLLNIEHPIIFHLKQQLLSNKISEDQFIEMAILLSKMRNDKAHGAMNKDERNEAFKRLKNRFVNIDVTFVQILQILLFQVRDWTNSNSDSSLVPNSTVIENTQCQRQKYRLVKIPEVQDENHVTQQFQGFVDRCSKDAGGIDIKPIAIAEINRSMYVLFKDFEGAYFFWKKRSLFSFATGTSDDNINIISVEDSRIAIGFGSEWYIKIVATKTAICNTIYTIVNELKLTLSPIAPKIFTGTTHENSSHSDKKRISQAQQKLKYTTFSGANSADSSYNDGKQTNPEPTLNVYYGFTKLENLLKTYQYCKSKITENVALNGAFKAAYMKRMVVLKC